MSDTLVDVLGVNPQQIRNMEINIIWNNFIVRITKPKAVTHNINIKMQPLTSYAPPVRTTSHFSNCDGIQSDLIRGNYDFYHLTKYDFILPGLGEKGQICGHKRITHFSDNMDAVKEGILRCKKMECPDCYPDWLKKRVFNMAVAIELTAYAQGQRPVNGVISVPPSKMDSWQWDNINNGYFRYPYKKLKERGVHGGSSMFHPFRIKKDIQVKLRSMRSRMKKSQKKKYANDVGLWRMIRENCLKLPDVYFYVNLSPHVHFIGVPNTDRPGYNKTKGVIIRYQTKDKKPLRLATVSDVVRKLFYILTHTGSLTLDKEYTKATRRFGNMQGSGFKKIVDSVPKEIYEKICCDVAEEIGMKYKDGKLEYPTDEKEENEYSWIPLRELKHYLHEPSFNCTEDEYEKYLFFHKMLVFMYREKSPGDEFFPSVEYLGEIPKSVIIVREITDKNRWLL